MVFGQWVGAWRMAAGSNIGEEERDGEGGAELAPSRVE